MPHSRLRRNSKSPPDFDTFANPDNCEDGLSRTSMFCHPLRSTRREQFLKASLADFLVKPIV